MPEEPLNQPDQPQTNVTNPTPTREEKPEVQTPQTTPAPPTPLPPEPPLIISPSTTGPKSRVKIIGSLVALLIFILSIPAAVFLVQQQQEIRERAAVYPPTPTPPPSPTATPTPPPGVGEWQSCGKHLCSNQQTEVEYECTPACNTPTYCRDKQQCPGYVPPGAHCTYDSDCFPNNPYCPGRCSVMKCVGGTCQSQCVACEEPPGGPTLTPTPTSPPVTYNCQCTTIRIYRGGVQIQPSDVKINDTLLLAGYGWTESPAGVDDINKFRFTIKRDGTVLDTKEVTAIRDAPQDQGGKRYYKGEYRNFKIEQPGSYTIEVLVHSPQRGWRGR